MFGNNKILGLENRNQIGIVNIFFTIQGEGPFAGMPALFIRLGGCNLACKFCDTEFDEFEYMEINQIIDICFEKMDASHKEDWDKIIKKHYLIVITGGEPFRQNISPLCNKLLSLGFNIQIETNGLLWRALDPRIHIVCSPKVILKNTKFMNQNITKHASINEITEPKVAEPKVSEPNVVESNVAESNSESNLEVNYQESLNKITEPKVSESNSVINYQESFIYSKPHPEILARAEGLKLLISETHKGYTDIPIWLKERLDEKKLSESGKGKIYEKITNSDIFLQPMDEYDALKNKANLDLAIKLASKYNLRLGIQMHKVINVE